VTCNINRIAVVKRYYITTDRMYLNASLTIHALRLEC